MINNTVTGTVRNDLLPFCWYAIGHYVFLESREPSLASKNDENDNQNWFNSYELPNFPLYVTEVLKEAKNSGQPENIPSSARHKILQVLFDSISVHTL